MGYQTVGGDTGGFREKIDDVVIVGGCLKKDNHHII
jgi:hypothetical protein